MRYSRPNRRAPAAPSSNDVLSGENVETVLPNVHSKVILLDVLYKQPASSNNEAVTRTSVSGLDRVRCRDVVRLSP
jgi:hypothetical protein